MFCWHAYPFLYVFLSSKSPKVCIRWQVSTYMTFSNIQSLFYWIIQWNIFPSWQRNFLEIYEIGNKQKRQKHKTLVFGEVNATEGFEFPVLSFKDVIAMTNNFHKSFMIGRGGFGKVYKVCMPFNLFSCLRLFSIVIIRD